MRLINLIRDSTETARRAPLRASFHKTAEFPRRGTRSEDISLGWGVHQPLFAPSEPRRHREDGAPFRFRGGLRGEMT